MVVENFRTFGEGDSKLVLALNPGLTAIVGENDTGKTAIMDAIRFALGTRDQEFLRVDELDFHLPDEGTARKNEISIRCKFSQLSSSDVAAFTEYLSYEQIAAQTVPVLYVKWHAVGGFKGTRRFVTIETKSGASGDGPAFDAETKALLCATYLRPLRDAERALSAGRGSRLSQILQHTKEVKAHGTDYDHANPPADPATLSVLGIADFANALLGAHAGIKSARERLNDDFLKELSFLGDVLEGHISVSGSRGDTSVRLRQLLEKLELDLRDGDKTTTANRGLGSNNILFMACELLLLDSETEGYPLLLVEEPEAHVHPQRQLRLMQFLQQRVAKARSDGQNIQILVTTHSPNLASAINLDNLVLLSGGKAFPLGVGKTFLSRSDYGFLSRFLDVTKANMFFARGLVIVEGDAENILLPALASLLGRDFSLNGVSVVNVGGVGLRRFSRIYQRSAPDIDGIIPVKVACVTDLDVMPNCAPEIVGRVEPGAAWPQKNNRRWRAKRDFTATELDAKREEILAKATGQNVETFVAGQWTLEYDLAHAGLACEVFVAAQLAKNDDRIADGKTSVFRVARKARKEFLILQEANPANDVLASHIYKPFIEDSSLSKATAAQYLAAILVGRFKRDLLTVETLRAKLPAYVIGAIEHVTVPRVDGEVLVPENGQAGEAGEISA